MNELYNRLRTWPHKSNSRAVHMLLYLVCHAKRVNVRSAGENVRRGQIMTSIPMLQKDLKLTTQQVRSTLGLLVSCGEITRQSFRRGSIITICNYESYQIGNEEQEQPEKHTDCQFKKCVSQAHQILDHVASMPEFTERKGMLTFRIPINCGGTRDPQIVFENAVGIEVRAGIEVVRKERMV